MSDDIESTQDVDGPLLPGESTSFLLDAKVGLRREREASYQVQAHDISRHGCKVEYAVRPQLGERVWVKFEGLEPLGAIVRRLEEGSADLEFEKPLHPAVFDLLLARLRRA